MKFHEMEKKVILLRMNHSIIDSQDYRLYAEQPPTPPPLPSPSHIRQEYECLYQTITV